MDFGDNGGQTPPNTGGNLNPTNSLGDAGNEPKPLDLNPNNPDPNPAPAGDGGQDDGKGADEGSKGAEPKNDGSDDINITPGTQVEFEGVSYTANEAGDLVDDKGVVFKKADEVKAWLKTMTIDSSDPKSTEIDVKSIQAALNINLVDENDKPIEFENTIEGVTSYVKNVVEHTREQHMNEGVEQLFATYPVLQEVLNYYVANGNTLDGFGGRPDRSNVEFDPESEEQHIAIIRTAWQENGRTGDIESYIQYLKSTGNLASTAEIELNGLKEADARYKKELADEAVRKEAEQVEYERQYWSGIRQKINAGTIGQYQIPEVISITRDGQKHNVTRANFFDYVYLRDKDGLSRYQRDLQSMKQEDIDNDQLIRAYLMFTGGSYDTLVDMAAKKKELSTLRLKTVKATSGVKITKPKDSQAPKTIDFGF